MTLVCSDRGNPPMTSSVNFVVVVGDVNDNAPVFLNDTYTVDLPENDVIGKTVLKVVVIRGVS